MEGFEESGDEIVPDLDVGDIISRLSSKSETMAKVQSKRAFVPMSNKADTEMNRGDGVSKEPISSSSKTLHFIRVLRPNLPRKSKTRAIKRLKSNTRGIGKSKSLNGPLFIKKRPTKKAVKKPINLTKRIKKLRPKVRRGLDSMSSESCTCKGDDHWSNAGSTSSSSPQSCCPCHYSKKRRH